ncbi:hypothetical protein PMAYCL1PPCAC_06923, partial [Pristionchus mayeri]
RRKGNTAHFLLQHTYIPHSTLQTLQRPFKKGIKLKTPSEFLSHQICRCMRALRSGSSQSSSARNRISPSAIYQNPENWDEKRGRSVMRILMGTSYVEGIREERGEVKTLSR